MKIYFCASIIGGRRLAHLARKIILELKKMNHTILTEYITKTDLVNQERKKLGKKFNYHIFKRDMEWLKNKTEIIIAEVSVPSIGVGYELSYALEYLKIPVLALYRIDLKKKVSPFILGNKNKNLTVIEYKHIDDVKSILEKYFNKII